MKGYYYIILYNTLLLLKETFDIIEVDYHTSYYIAFLAESVILKISGVEVSKIDIETIANLFYFRI